MQGCGHVAGSARRTGAASMARKCAGPRQPSDTAGGSRAGGAAPTENAAAPVVDDHDSVRFPIGTTVEEAEKGLILRTLEHTRNNKTRAAEILGISLKTLHNKLKEYGAKEFGIGA